MRPLHGARRRANHVVIVLPAEQSGPPPDPLHRKRASCIAPPGSRSALPRPANGQWTHLEVTCSPDPSAPASSPQHPSDLPTGSWRTLCGGPIELGGPTLRRHANGRLVKSGERSVRAMLIDRGRRSGSTSPSTRTSFSSTSAMRKVGPTRCSPAIDISPTASSDARERRITTSRTIRPHHRCGLTKGRLTVPLGRVSGVGLRARE